MDHTQKADIPLARHVEVSEALHYLVRQLGCDNWYVACHHQQLFVFRLTLDSVDRFAVTVECSAPVEKGVYHDCKATAISITPLHHEASLEDEKIKVLQRGLAEIK